MTATERPKPPNAGKGRPKGSVNKATAEIRVAAQAYTQRALETLASIMQNSENDSARVSAANSILDRGYGKPLQATTVSNPEGGPVDMNVTLDLSSLTMEQKRALASIKIGE